MHSISDGIAELADQVKKCVVLLNGRRGHGAGTIWHARGLILTNAHVVRRRAPKVTLWDGRAYESRILASDRGLDIAALAIEAEDLDAISLGDSRNLRPGAFVLAVGHPWGVVGAASAGAVIDVGRPLDGPAYDGDLIQTGIWLRPGHSGGPLIDARGQLVGINTMISGPQVGLAIPVHLVKAFLSRTLRPAAAAQKA